jgi:hypothetical protein
MNSESLSKQPRMQGGDITCAEITVPARAPSIAGLSLAPRDLYQQWNEHLHGIGGRKPAKHFSQRNRGRVTHTYSLRNNVWHVIGELSIASIRSAVLKLVSHKF